MHRAVEYNVLDTPLLSGRREIKRKAWPGYIPFFCRILLTADLDGCLSKHLLTALHPRIALQRLIVHLPLTLRCFIGQYKIK